MATKRSDAWELRYKELMDYKEEHGDCNVPQSMGGLGDWVFNQRISYTKGSLSRERVGRLEEIGFTRRFVATDEADVLTKLQYWEELWDWRYRELKEYRDKHGDCNVPQSKGSLGVWVDTQRQSYKKGKLSDERIARLDVIGFAWDPLEQEWLGRFEELTNYKAENGDCNVPQSQGPLGAWVDKQRVKYKTGKLSQERADLLDCIGFSWEPIDEAWTARFDELVDFKNENGDCNVPMRQGSLGMWVANQRSYYKNGKLSQERIEFLESVGFEWVRQVQTRTQSWKLDERWKMKYTELVQYLIEHGNCNVPRKYGPLGRWVGNQRTAYKDGSMSQFRIDYLDSIGFVWTTKRVGNEWHPDQYSEPDPKAIARIIEDEKPRHDDLPAGATEELKTRVNVGKRLAESLQEYLDSDSTRLIQTYDKPQKIDVKWQKRYTELVRHLIEHGDWNVPQRQGPLRTWVDTQRTSHRKGRLSQLRKEYLEIIGFTWTTKRVGNEWHPDQYSKPDTKAIARMIADERPQNDDLPASATEGLKTRVNVGRCLAEALQEYLDKLENNK